MDIKDTFLRLTSKTYPHGHETELDHLLIDGLEYDEFGNRYIKIGDSNCMFTSHLDTATSAKTDVVHVFDKNIIKTDGKSILGADDKAGVTVMFYMILNKVPGLYYFFMGEEVGCVGSKKVSARLKDPATVLSLKDPLYENITKVISFDRRGTDSIITFQASSRCCSDEFAQALSDELNKNDATFSYKPDPTGVYTDSAQFTRIYPECTNISVGYRSEHTYSESQDIEHLTKLSKACLLVNWESLPVTRDPSKYEGRSYGGYWSGGYGDEYGWDADDYGYGSRYYPNRIPPKDENEIVYFFDTEYEEISSIKKNKVSNRLVSVDFSKDRIADERNSIIGLLDSLEVDYRIVNWDGYKLVVTHNPPVSNITECDRDELAEFLPLLDFWKNEIENDYSSTSSSLSSLII